MKKLTMLAIATILAISVTVPVMAGEEQEKSIFETDASICKEGALSVYRKDIRENVKGEFVDCNCRNLCSCTSLYHVLEDTTESDFYSVCLKEKLIRPIGKIYQDCSSSMEETFRYEKSNIIQNLSPFLKQEKKEIEAVFKNKKTNLYGLLSSFPHEKVGKLNITKPKNTPIIITDLWDEKGEEEEFWYDGEIVFCVPYASTNKKAVLHCEEVVNNILWNHDFLACTMSIYVIYTDEVIVEYGNSYYNGDEGCITIYVP